MAAIGPYNYRFKGISVFLEVRSQAIDQAMSLCREKCGDAAPTFAPHITMLYGVEGKTPKEMTQLLQDMVSSGDFANFDLAVAQDRFQGGWKFGDFEIEYANPDGGMLDKIHKATNSLFPGTMLMETVPELLSKSVPVTALCLYSTDGTPNEWTKLAEIPLQST